MRKFLTSAITALTSALAISSAVAQTPAPPTPSCQSDEYRAFDFWLGDWDVYTTTGQLAGTNSIQVQENGCMLLENWTSAKGNTGQSYNFYDPGMEKFRQVWVSGGAVIDYAGGLNDAGEMVMDGTIAYHNGTTAPFRGTWTLNEDGTVRQYFQQFDNSSEQWADWFTGIYKKRTDLGEQISGE